MRQIPSRPVHWHYRVSTLVRIVRSQKDVPSKQCPKLYMLSRHRIITVAYRGCHHAIASWFAISSP
jgi:hypothetical protein